MARVVVTRSQPGAAATAARLAALGRQALVAPLTAIVPAAELADDGAGAQALLFTSAHAVRAFAALSARRAAQVLAVGAATAEVARTAGFGDVASADGDAAALAALAARTLAPAAGPLLHLRGDVTAGDLAGRLRAAGFTVREAEVYSQAPVAALPEPLEEALGGPLTILFHAPRAAGVFARLAAGRPLQRARACAISTAAAAPLAGCGFGAVRVAARPDEDALLACLPPAGEG